MLILACVFEGKKKESRAEERALANRVAGP
jgi:hypothetical protein